jgi:AcrR family transcriptional regulator
MSRKKNVRANERPGRPLANPDRDTRALLIHAATELFAEQGVAATTLTTIARRAGLTPAMVHYHFKDRDQLIDAVVNERLAPLIAYVWDPIAPEDKPGEMVSGIVERLLEQIERAPWVPSTWMREVLNEKGLLRSRVLPRLPLEKVKLLGKAIASAQAYGDANVVLEPFLVAFSVLGLVMVHMATKELWTLVFERPLDDKTIKRHITGILLHGLAPWPKASRSAPRQLSTRRKS